jgi:hypothetical protein
MRNIKVRPGARRGGLIVFYWYARLTIYVTQTALAARYSAFRACKSR